MSMMFIMLKWQKKVVMVLVGLVVITVIVIMLAKTFFGSTVKTEAEKTEITQIEKDHTKVMEFLPPGAKILKCKQDKTDDGWWVTFVMKVDGFNHRFLYHTKTKQLTYLHSGN